MGRAFVFFGVAIAACWTERAPQPPPTTIGNHVAQRHAALAGAYWCAITEDDYAYPRFPCAIRERGGHLVLAKLGGSVRFDGDIVPEHGGFRFTGRMYCPWGDCTQPLHGVFAPKSGTYHGTFSDDAMVVELVPASGLGGDGYGGDAYGGGAYGGASYGNYAPSGRRNRRP
jgi:hypothetical protein